MTKKLKIRYTSLFISMCLLGNLFFILINTKSFITYLTEYREFFRLILQHEAEFFHYEYFTSNELYEKFEMGDFEGIENFFDKIKVRNPFLGEIVSVDKSPAFEGETYYITSELNNLVIYLKIFNADFSIVKNQYIMIDYDEKGLLERLQQDRKMIFSDSGDGYDFIYGIKVRPVDSMLHLYELVLSVFWSLLCTLAYYAISHQIDSFFYKSKGLKKIIFLFEKTEEYSANHSRNVAEIAYFLGRKYGMKGKKLNDLKVAAYLHDIGKISIPVEILNKPGSLNKDEFGEIKKHVNFSAEIIENFEELKHLKDMILYHHEKIDGSGYPEGLEGDAIPLGSRILAVADIYEALVGQRPYRDSFNMDKALFTMRNLPLDRNVFDILIEFRYEVHALITIPNNEPERKISTI